MTDPVQDEWNRLVKQSRKNPGQPPPSGKPASRLPGGRARKWGLPILLLLSVGALALYFQGTLDPYPAKPTPEELRAGQKASLLLVSKAIHDYGIFHGKYPRSVQEVMPVPINVDYRQTADGFELKMIDSDGTPLVVQGK
ncbi:hypothetical protein [Dyella sedimenti]|uniref:hypothetical protein n=1 Tax=Dyella sedimenti TaxID=2919947 RepID=UPI001FA9AC31|nr:hypothetical protein [Dyella sedimenti]